MTASICGQAYYDSIINRLQTGDGSLVLLHDIHSTTVTIFRSFMTKLLQFERNRQEVDPYFQWDFISVQDIPAVKEMYRRNL